MNGISFTTFTPENKRTFAPFISKTYPKTIATQPILNSKQQEPEKKSIAGLIASLTGGSILGIALLIGTFSKGANKWTKNNIKKLLVTVNTGLGKLLNIDKQKLTDFDKEKILIRGNIGNFLGKVLNTMVNIDQYKNYYLKKFVNFIPPFKFVIDKFENFLFSGTKRTTAQKYKNTVNIWNKVQDNLFNIKSLLNKNNNSKIEAELNNLLDTNGKSIDTLIRSIGYNYKNKRLKTINFDLMVKKYNEYIEGNINKAKNISKDTVIKDASQFTTDLVGDVISRAGISKEIKTYKKELYAKKDEISRSVTDNYIRVNHLLDQVEENILGTFFSEETRKTVPEFLTKLKNLRETAEKYKKGLSEAGNELHGKQKTLRRKELKQTFEKEAIEFINTLKEASLKTEDIKTQNLFTCASQSLKDAVDRLNIDKKGRLQEIRTLLKDKDLNLKGKNEKLYNDVMFNLKELEKQMGEAVEFETNDSLFRLAELKLGAAVTEILGPVIAAGLLTKEVIQADTKEEKMSKAIKMGTPITGGMGMWVYTALIKSMDGSKALLLSLGAGFVFSKLGKYIDEKLFGKKIAQQSLKQTQPVENKSIKKDFRF